MTADLAQGERCGVFGGVFDPVHYAHLAVAEQVRDALGLERVIFVPAGRPAHRGAPHAASADRLAMLERAIADNRHFELSDIEIERDGPSYSVDTAAQLTRERPSTRLVWVLSAESASYLPEWRDPERLVDMADIAIVPRLGHADISLEWLGSRFPGRTERFTFVPTTRLGHSSSDVRSRLAAGRSIRYLVPPAVEEYIREHDLYGPDDRPAA